MEFVGSTRRRAERRVARLIERGVASRPLDTGAGLFPLFTPRMSRHQAGRQFWLSARRKLHYRWCGPACFACGPPFCCYPRTRLAAAIYLLADFLTYLRALRTLSFLNGRFLHGLAPGLGRGGCAAMAGRLLGGGLCRGGGGIPSGPQRPGGRRRARRGR